MLQHTGNKRERMVPRARFELTTYGLGNRCSILLSYRGSWAINIAAAHRKSSSKGALKETAEGWDTGHRLKCIIQA